MNREYLSTTRRIRALAFVLIGLTAIFFLVAALYIPVHARFHAEIGSSLIVGADFARRLLKTTATLFFVFLPLIACVFLGCSAMLLSLAKRVSQMTSICGISDGAEK